MSALEVGVLQRNDDGEVRAEFLVEHPQLSTDLGSLLCVLERHFLQFHELLRRVDDLFRQVVAIQL